MKQEVVFATLRKNVEKIQNSNFGKKPKIALRLQEIKALVRKLERYSSGQRISDPYLFGLTVDAWNLEKVAAAASGKYTFFPSISPPSIVAENSFFLFSAPHGDHDSREKASTHRNNQVFATNAAGGIEKLTQLLYDVLSDLIAKARFAEKNPSTPFKSVFVNVSTLNGKNELGGYEVWYSLKGLLEYPDRHRHFDRVSSPTSCPLPPGNYMLWTRGGSAAGPQSPLGDLGSDGRPVRSVSLPVIP
jgi:hypothetical protein